MSSSRLYYNGSSIDVRLGDRVRIRRLFRADLQGTVCYIPGLSPRHRELEDAGVKQWAIRSDDGSVYPILYDPDHFQPPSKIVFVARGDGPVLKPEDHLE